LVPTLPAWFANAGANVFQPVASLTALRNLTLRGQLYQEAAAALAGVLASLPRLQHLALDICDSFDTPSSVRLLPGPGQQHQTRLDVSWQQLGVHPQATGSVLRQATALEVLLLTQRLIRYHPDGPPAPEDENEAGEQPPLPLSSESARALFGSLAQLPHLRRLRYCRKGVRWSEQQEQAALQALRAGLPALDIEGGYL
jgi:hypothetical protein